MNREQPGISPEEMGSIQEGLDKAATEAEKEAEGKEKLKDLTDEDIKSGLSGLEEDSQRAAVDELAGATEEDIDKAVDTLGKGGPTDTEIQTGQALNEAVEKFDKKAEIDAALKEAQDKAKE